MADKEKLSKERNTLANTVIKNHMIWSMGAGFIPVPVADFLAVGAIQLDMVRQLCKLYGLDFKESEGKALVSAITGSGLAKIGARAVVKMIPGFGQIVGGAALAIFAGASTYALGEVFKRHFESGGTILDFDAEGLKKMYDEKFEKGKELARKIRSKQEKERSDETKIVDDPKSAPGPGSGSASSDEDLVSRLSALAELKNSGALTQDEYEKAKAKIIGN